MKEERFVFCGEIIPECRQVCPNCYHKVRQSKTRKRKDFLNALYDIAEYWKDKEDATFGTIFSVLVMFDGDSSANDFERLEIKGISNNKYLHDEFCRIEEERSNKDDE